MTINNENDSDREALELAKAAAREKMIVKPTPRNVAAFEAARTGLEKFTAAGEEKPEIYESRAVALQQLQADGYKIKKSKFYENCQRGLCKLNPDGSVEAAELKRYLRRIGIEKLAEISSDPATDILAKKNEKEVERLEEQIAKLRREREIVEGRYLERDIVEMELAGKCAVLEAGLRHLFHVRLVDWIETAAAHGFPAALDAAQQDLNAQFNEFASLDDFEVLIGG